MPRGGAFQYVERRDGLAVEDLVRRVVGRDHRARKAESRVEALERAKDV